MTYIEAEYQDGYVHSEDALNDVSPYVAGKNIFYDILNNLPAAEHGRLKRFTLVREFKAYSIDWTSLPANARPIRFKNMVYEKNNQTGEEVTFIRNVQFGYQYNDEDGKNVQRIMTL